MYFDTGIIIIRKDDRIRYIMIDCWYMFFLGAAGNFLCPAEGLSFNAFRTVMDIDAIGTFNTTKVVFDEYMKVSVFI